MVYYSRLYWQPSQMLWRFWFRGGTILAHILAQEKKEQLAIHIPVVF